MKIGGGETPPPIPPRTSIPPRTRLLCALILLAVTLAGCGYSVRGRLPSHIKTVGVRMFANRSTEPFVEGIITRAIVQAFSTNGRLKVVSPDEADAVLEGDVAGYTVTSIAFDPSANVRQYRLLVTLNLRFRDVREGKLLFEQTGLQERADFQVVSAVVDTISREETAITQAAADIARAVVNLAIERF